MQKVIWEKEYELVTIKNQKLENLCRALQEERKSLYDKLQRGGPQPDSSTSDPAKVEGCAEQETPKVAKDDHPLQNPAAADGTLTVESPPVKELAKLKTKQARLKEIASSFTISPVLVTEKIISQSEGLSAGVQDPDEELIEERKHLQEVDDDGYQQLRELEMESVD